MLAIRDLLLGFLIDSILLSEQIAYAFVFWIRNAQISMVFESVFEHRVELNKFAMELLQLFQDHYGLNLNPIVQISHVIEHLEVDILFQCLTIKASSENLEIIIESIFNSCRAL